MAENKRSRLERANIRAVSEDPNVVDDIVGRLEESGIGDKPQDAGIAEAPDAASAPEAKKRGRSRKRQGEFRKVSVDLPAELLERMSLPEDVYGGRVGYLTRVIEEDLKSNDGKYRRIYEEKYQREWDEA